MTSSSRPWSVALWLILLAGGLGACEGMGTEPGVEFDVKAQAVLYGGDDRRDYYELSAVEAEWADAVALVVLGGPYADCEAGTCTIPAGFFGYVGNEEIQGSDEMLPLCANVPFRNQPRHLGAACTGFLVNDDVLITAGHCLNTEEACAEMEIIFGFVADGEDAQAVQLRVPEDHVYGCNKVIASEYDADTGKDWGVLQLDRPATTTHSPEPLAFRREGVVEAGAPMTLVGHPRALPLKVSAQGVVTGAGGPFTFPVNNDAMPGTSGAPVLNATTGVVEGIMVGGPIPTFITSTAEEGEICATERTCGEQNASGCGGLFAQATRVALAAQGYKDCTDGERSGNESDVDCGGVCARACARGQRCRVSGDCEQPLSCHGGLCQPGFCENGSLDSQEADVDCGAVCARRCQVSARCQKEADCQSDVCQSGLCRVPACGNGERDLRETGTDCGGPDCAACGFLSNCLSDADCRSGRCAPHPYIPLGTGNCR